MPVLVHLSDLHFGRTDATVVEALLADLIQNKPDLVIISGDLTQRARSRQFAEARAFLDRLPAPALVVPGNHDLAPFYSLNRLFRPRAKFENHLAGHADAPIWRDDSLVVVGLDSTRHLRWKSGKLRASHLDKVELALEGAPPGACKVTFLHHPPTTTSQSGHSFTALADLGVDLILAGHVHHAHMDLIDGGYHGSSVLIQASTACSTRLREDANGYCVIRVDMPRVAVELRGWSGERFHAVRHQDFHKIAGQWQAKT